MTPIKTRDDDAMSVASMGSCASHFCAHDFEAGIKHLAATMTVDPLKVVAMVRDSAQLQALCGITQPDQLAEALRAFGAEDALTDDEDVDEAAVARPMAEGDPLVVA
eukprot:5620056-Pyramimonas_sp.AAC.1